MIVLVLIDSGDAGVLSLLLMLLPVLPVLKLNFVSFDTSAVYISGGFKTRVFLVRDLKSINQGQMFSLDPWYELEFYDRKGETIKFDFAPHFNEQVSYSMHGKLTGRLKELDDARRDSLERTLE